VSDWRRRTRGRFQEATGGNEGERGMSTGGGP